MLGGWDLAVAGGAVGLLFVIAWLTGRGQQDTRDFFLGRRRIPWLVVCLSFVATEVSAASIMGNPATGYGENMQYLQFFAGSAAARIFVAFIFIPAFYRHDCTTIYEFLRRRFGPATHYAGSVCFFITRLLASGVRLYAACLGIAGILGWDLRFTLLLFTAASIAFITFGGIRAVVWTGAYSTLLFYGAGLAAIGWLLLHIQGGWPEVQRLAEAAPGGSRLSVWNFRFDLGDPTTFWAGGLNAFFIGLAVFGADQELVQRLLTVDTRRSSQKALVGTIAAALPFAFIYLFMGVLMYAFFAQNPQLPGPDQAKNVLPHFTLYCLPAGLKGLILAVIVLASIDSPLSSLSSSFVTDIYRPLIRPGASERHYLLVSRAGVAGFGLLLAALALACRPLKNVLWAAFQVLSVTGGSLLGVFLLGLLTKRKGSLANVLAMIASAVWMASLLYLSHPAVGAIRLGWSWLIVIGTAMTFGLGWLLSLLEERGRAGMQNLE